MYPALGGVVTYFRFTLVSFSWHRMRREEEIEDGVDWNITRETQVPEVSHYGRRLRIR